MAADKVALSVETRDSPPAHLLMRIESFSMLSHYKISKYESREFEAGDHKWKLIIYPNGDEFEDHVAAYISMITTTSLPLDWEVKAIFNIFLFNQHSDNYLCFRDMHVGNIRRFSAMNLTWGHSKLISKKIFRDPSKGYLVRDKCIFGAEVFVCKRQQVFEFVSLLQDTVPCKHDLEISGFSKLTDIWTSEEFSAGGYKWNIKVHPNGNGRGKDRYVSIYLQCLDCKSFDPHQKVMANFTISIENKLHLPNRSFNASHWFTRSEDGLGWANFITIDDMRDPKKGFVVDDCCFLEIEISIRAVVGYAPKLE